MDGLLQGSIACHLCRLELYKGEVVVDVNEVSLPAIPQPHTQYQQ